MESLQRSLSAVIIFISSRRLLGQCWGKKIKIVNFITNPTQMGLHSVEKCNIYEFVLKTSTTPEHRSYKLTIQ